MVLYILSLNVTCNNLPAKIPMLGKYLPWYLPFLPYNVIIPDLRGDPSLHYNVSRTAIACTVAYTGVLLSFKVTLNLKDIRAIKMFTATEAGHPVLF